MALPLHAGASGPFRPCVKHLKEVYYLEKNYKYIYIYINIMRHTKYYVGYIIHLERIVLLVFYEMKSSTMSL
jgi:hypothetical protein